VALHAGRLRLNDDGPALGLDLEPDILPMGTRLARQAAVAPGGCRRRIRGRGCSQGGEDGSSEKTGQETW